MPRFGYVLTLLFGVLATPAVAQNGLYQPAKADPTPASPMGTFGMFIERDSVFYLDSITVRQVAPAPEYDLAWKGVADCSGLKLSDSMLVGWTISAAPGDGFIPHGMKDPVPGYTFVETRNIVVLEKYVHNHALIGHEMIHALLWENGFRDVAAHHKRHEFADCGLQGQ